MKRPASHITKLEEETSDCLSTIEPHSGHSEDAASPYNRRNSHPSDSESFSDSSRRNRKKRDAYQKISDEIRLSLLDSVKNGETLKSAAKRFKINYSSAKSILHTYRKEGRILKKSAQERTMKKKNSVSAQPKPQTVRPAKLLKKSSTMVSESKAVPSQAKMFVTERPKSENTTASYHEEPSPAVSVGCGNDNMFQKNFHEDYYHNQSKSQGMAERQVQSNEERGMNTQKTYYQTDEMPSQRPHFINNFYGNFPENNFMEGYQPINLAEEASRSSEFAHFANEFDTFNGIPNAWHTKFTFNDDIYNNDPNNFLRVTGVDDKIGGCEDEMDYRHGSFNSTPMITPQKNFTGAQTSFFNSNFGKVYSQGYNSNVPEFF